MQDHETSRTAARAHWDAVYGVRAPTEVSWYQDRPEPSLSLIGRALADQGAGAEAGVVDVGGGASRLVDALLDAGRRRVTVLDLSALALARSRERLGPRAGQVTWLVADATAWTPPARFHVWHDRAVFHFLVEAADRQRYLAALAAALAPGGHAVIGTFAADGPERCSGLPVRRWEPEALAAELGPGFRLVEHLHETHRTPGGGLQRFQFSRLVRT